MPEYPKGDVDWSSSEPVSVAKIFEPEPERTPKPPMDWPVGPQAESLFFAVKRRTLPEQIRYCAEQLRAHPGDVITAQGVAVALDLAADRLDGIELP